MSDRPDVLFVVLDSMRKDRVSAYDHRRETTPALSELSTHATAFEQAYAPAPWTLPSHCSMFAGSFPSEHGVTNGFADGSVRLPAGIETLPEGLSAAGYRTAGFSNNPWVGQLSGLDRGFDEFVEWDLEVSRSRANGTVPPDADDGGVAPDAEEIHAARDRAYSRLHAVVGNAARQPLFLLKRRFFTRNLVERATRWIDATAGEPGPTFTFLNLMEAHSPYFPPSSAFRALDLDPPGVLEPRILNTKLLAYVMGNLELSEEQRRRVMEYYDASLRYQDARLADLLSALRRNDRYDDALVVVCSDHGKTLGEFDRDETPPHYTRSINVNVPLFVKRPGQAEPRRERSPVELAGVDELIRSGGATTLREASGDRDVALVEDFVPHTGSESPAEVTRWRVAAAPDRRLVRGEDGEEYLFAADGGRDERIHDPDPAELDPLRTALEDRVESLDAAASAERESVELDRTVEAQLEDLGYM